MFMIEFVKDFGGFVKVVIPISMIALAMKGLLGINDDKAFLMAVIFLIMYAIGKHIMEKLDLASFAIEDADASEYYKEANLLVFFFACGIPLLYYVYCFL